jgi:hypothetical protein
MALAKQYGFEDYATPAGGCCFLTDKQYHKPLTIKAGIHIFTITMFRI